jgi:uncharacterized RDD family membrane protein YckC
MPSKYMELASSLFIALFVWLYYRHRTFSPTDRYYTFGPRFWTGSVDACVLWPVGVITFVLFSLNFSPGATALVLIIENFAWVAYTILMHARYGQTIGKMITHVKVVDFRTEGKISFEQALLREGIPMLLALGFIGYEVFEIFTGKLTLSDLAKGKDTMPANNMALWILTALPALWYLAEVLTMLTNDKRRALHDIIAGTVVVRTNIEQISAQNVPSKDSSTPTMEDSAISEVPLS